MYSFTKTLTAPAESRLRPSVNVVIWAGQAFLAFSLFFAGASKLAGAEQAVALFEAVGVGHWFRYATGLIEVVGAIALVIPSLTLRGVVVLSTVMIGAVLTHLFVIGGSPLAAIIHLALLLTIGWARLRWPLMRLRNDEAMQT